MANMFKPVKAKTVAQYIAAVPEERRTAVRFLHDFIRKSTPKLKAHFAYNMIGYGSFPYRNYKKELMQWPIIALANQKHYLSVYVCATDKGQYLAEKHKAKLGKVSVGKSCIRFKRIEDVNLRELRVVLKAAERSPGLVGAAGSR